MTQNISISESKQNILLRNCKKITDFFKRVKLESFEQNPNRMFYILDVNDPELTVNRMTGIEPRLSSRFTNMTNLERNFLIPVLEISRITSDGIETPIQFTGYFTEDYVNFIQDPKMELLSQENSPVSGCGIKRLLIEERPENLADVNIKATLELVFENAAALLQSNIKELITTPKKISKNDPLDYRLRVRVGWRVPEDCSNYIDDEFKQAIEKCNKLYLFELIGHNLSFKMNGKISLTINYQGALEGAFESERSDLIGLEALSRRVGANAKGTVKENLEKYNNLKKEMDALTKKKDEIVNYSQQFKREPDTKKIDKEIKKKEEEIQKIKKELLNYIYSSFLNDLYGNSEIYSIEIIEEWFKTEPFKSTATLLQNLTGALGSTSSPFYQAFYRSAASQDFIVKDPEVHKISNTVSKFVGRSDTDEIYQIEARTDIVSIADDGIEFEVDTPEGVGTEPDVDEGELDADKIKIAFFTYGDLIQSVLKSINSPELDRYRIILGGIKYYNNQTQTTYIMNLADIPISVDLFNQWFFNTVIKERKEVFYLKHFILDSLNTLVVPLLGFKSGTGQPLFANYTPDISIITSSQDLPRKKRLKDADIVQLVRTSEKEIKKSTKTYQYMLVNLLWPTPGSLVGNLENDLINGVQHIRIGQTDGLLKNISFEKTDFSEYRSARMVGDQLNTAGEILREQYDCTVNLIGNPLFYNGSYFFVDSSYMGDIGRAAQNLLGVGGYYLINGIETTIQPHKYDMTVKGFWQFAGTDFYSNQADMLKANEAKAKKNNPLKPNVADIEPQSRAIDELDFYGSILY
jgi:hypothetical protein